MSGFSVEELVQKNLDRMHEEDRRRREQYRPVSEDELRREYYDAYQEAVASQRRVQGSDGSAE